MTITRKRICDAIAKSLVDFGYPDVTAKMIGEILDAYVEGKRFPDLPHGVIGGFAESQLKEVADAGVDLAGVK